MTPLSGAFYQISIGDRLLFTRAVERCGKEEAEAEFAYWRCVFGNDVALAVLEPESAAAAELVGAQMTYRIAHVLRQMPALTREALRGAVLDAGFTAAQVGAHFDDALVAVSREYGDELYGTRHKINRTARDLAAQRDASRPDNVVPLRPRWRRS